MDSISLFSRVPAALLRTSLLRGTALAAVGGVLLCVFGAYLPMKELAVWGWLLFGVGVALIICGLRPYRRLVQLQEHPHSLRICSNEVVEYRDHKGRLRLTVPFSAIADLRCLQDGIGVVLKDPPPEPLTLHHPPMDIESMRKKLKKSVGCDLLFPLFDKESCLELRDCVFIDELV